MMVILGWIAYGLIAVYTLFMLTWGTLEKLKEDKRVDIIHYFRPSRNIFDLT